MLPLMSIIRLKLVYAIFTIAVAALFGMAVRRGAEPIWVLWVYLATASAFAAGIITSTLHAAKRTGPMTLRRLSSLLISVRTMLPPAFGLWMLWQRGPVTGALTFLLVSAVIALI